MVETVVGSEVEVTVEGRAVAAVVVTVVGKVVGGSVGTVEDSKEVEADAVDAAEIGAKVVVGDTADDAHT